jgi:hypothetical protein
MITETRKTVEKGSIMVRANNTILKCLSGIISGYASEGPFSARPELNA